MNRTNIPAIVDSIVGNMFMANPVDLELLRKGVPIQWLLNSQPHKVGDRGFLSYTSTPTRGTWVFHTELR